MSDDNRTDGAGDHSVRGSLPKRTLFWYWAIPILMAAITVSSIFVFTHYGRYWGLIEWVATCVLAFQIGVLISEGIGFLIRLKKGRVC